MITREAAGRLFAVGEGLLRTISQALFKPYASATRGVSAGGYLTGLYGLFLMVYGVILLRSWRLLRLERPELLWILLMGWGSALRSVFYYAAYVMHAPEVIPYFAINALTTFWLVLLSRVITGDVPQRSHILAVLFSIVAAYFLFHCPDLLSEKVLEAPLWIPLCVLVSPFSGLSLLSARRLAQTHASIAKLTFWNGVALVLTGAVLLGWGLFTPDDSFTLPSIGWVLLLASNLLSVFYVPLAFLALQRIQAVDKNFWMILALSFSTLALRYARLSLSEQPNWNELSMEGIGIALYSLSAILMTTDKQR